MKTLYRVLVELCIVFCVVCGAAIAQQGTIIGGFAALLNPIFPSNNLVRIGNSSTSGGATTTPAQLFFNDYQTSGNVIPGLLMNWNGPGYLGVGPSSSSGTGNAAKFRIGNIGNNDPRTAQHTWDTTQEVDLEIPNGQVVTTCKTVSTLPTGAQGGRQCVTDATSCTFLGALTGGGSTVCPVFFNGTSWLGG